MSSTLVERRESHDESAERRGAAWLASPETWAEQELVARCCAGSPAAWQEIVRRYTPLILSIARRSLRARSVPQAADDLEDICENTFYAFVKDEFALLRAYDPTYALSTFVGVVARTQAGRFLRRRRGGFVPDIDVAEIAAASGAGTDPALEAETHDLHEALHETLDELSERDRTILRLFYFRDRDYRAIADELGISPNSVGAALHRARERLRARLENRWR